jgi:gamma-glutamyl:cysteine ligase YbdK (ATP-grasp superfamily)
MGSDIDRHQFEATDYARFSRRLRACLDALEEVLARPGFGVGPTTVGAELEVDLIDGDGRPLLAAEEVLRAAAADPRVTPELNRFNLEINSPPVALAGAPLTALAGELDGGLAAIRRATNALGGDVVAVGILPTLEERDLAPSVMTVAPRYRALSAGLQRLRHERFRVHIEGPHQSLELALDDVAAEGANTSLQLHLRVAPDDFARTYNAAQLATGAVLAVCGNAPFFLGRRLWDETRIALFRQAVDDRTAAHDDDWRPARVTFGHGWLRHGAADLFAESVALHEPLIPFMSDEDPLAVVRAGGVPQLRELRLHHGTVWRWNRAVYDHADGGHLRIELRALPAGPTLVDMAANAAFLLGLTLGLAPDSDRLVRQITFGQARRNFYQAARHGLDAELLWPRDESPSPHPMRVDELVPELLVIARRGLVDGGVTADEADRHLDVIRARVERSQTGARWQVATARAVGRAPTCMQQLVKRYAELAASEQPVHVWPIGIA